MLIEGSTSLDLVKRHLKDNYSLGCKFDKHNKPPKGKETSFQVNDEVVIREIVNFFYNRGFQLKIFNSEGISIPIHLTLEEGKNFNIDRNDDHDFQQVISSLVTIVNSSKYEDIEWVKRLFLRAHKKASADNEKVLVNQLLEKVHAENEKFLDSDLMYVKQRMNI